MATMKTLNGYGFNATEFNGKTSDNYLKKTDTASNSAKLGGKAANQFVQSVNKVTPDENGTLLVNELVGTNNSVIALRNEGDRPGINFRSGDDLVCGLRTVKGSGSNGFPLLQQINSADNASTNIYTEAYPPPCSRYQINGKLISSANDSIVGYGSACVLLLQNGIARIDFSAKIETAGTNINNFTWGLNRDYFIDATGKTITPIYGGVLEYLKSSGIDAERRGMGGIFIVSDHFWVPSRVYDTGGNAGSWASGNIDVGTCLFGTCYGTYR